METSVRQGTPADLPRLLELITELAIYEKEPDAVEVTVAELEHYGFGAHKEYDFFVAEINGKVEAIALYYFKFSTWKGRCLYLEDIVVNQDLRKNGIGQLLFNEVVKVAIANSCKRMEWQVLKWNTPAIEFYTQKYGAHLDGEWYNGRLNEQDLARLAQNIK
jgi:GNAT superfamily N-acetyltransferase